MTNEPLEVVDSSSLLDADWAEINSWRKVLRQSGLEGLAVAIDALTDRDISQSGLILTALFPSMIPEIIRDELASRGITQEDLLDAIRTARGRLKALLRAFLPDRSRPAGCLIGRSCAEISALSNEGRAATLAAAARQREILAGVLREGVAAGELAADTDIDVLNLPQADADPTMLDRMIDVAMSVWPSTRLNDS